MSLFHDFSLKPHGLSPFTQGVNMSMVKLRAEGYRQEYNTAAMSRLIAEHNKTIVDRLENIPGLNLASLAPMLDLNLELKKRSDAARSAVQIKVDAAKNIEAQKSAVDAAQQVPTWL